MGKKKTGRPSLFRGKDLTQPPIRGAMTAAGRRAFEVMRRRLARIATELTDRKWTANDVSDGDTIEYLALGEEVTRAYLKKHAA